VPIATQLRRILNKLACPARFERATYALEGCALSLTTASSWPLAALEHTHTTIYKQLIAPSESHTSIGVYWCYVLHTNYTERKNDLGISP